MAEMPSGMASTSAPPGAAGSCTSQAFLCPPGNRTCISSPVTALRPRWGIYSLYMLFGQESAQRWRLEALRAPRSG